MQLFGNIVLGLASFITLVPLPLLLSAARRGSSDGSALWGGIFVFLPLWLLLAVGLAVTAAQGGLEWVPLRRGGQYVFVILACIALFVTSLFGFLGRVEHAMHLPVVARPFLGWADLALPVAVMAFLLCTLNGGIGGAVPAVLYRAPFGTLAGASMLFGVALLGEWAVRAQAAEVARANADAQMYTDARQKTLERLDTLDAEKDLAEILERAAHTHPEIRTMAMNKLASHPDLLGGLAAVLRSRRAEAAFAYLETHDLATEEKRTLAPAILDGLGELTRSADDEIYRSTHFHPDQFDRRTRLVLAVADRFAGLSPDYNAAVREFRRVLDTEGAAKAHFNARAHIDAWLARHRATASANP